MRIRRSVLLVVSLLLCLSTISYAQEDEPIGVPVQPLGEGPWVIDTAEQHKVRVTAVVRGLSHPWAIAFMPDGGMLITERDGRLRVVRDDTLDPNPITGVPEVRTDGNGGLMDVAVHPDFADNGLVYLTYTKGHDDGRGSPALARGRLEGGALHDVEDLVVTEPFYTNSGLNGRVAFGRDGKVYMSTGGRIRSLDGDLLDAPQDPREPARQGSAPQRRRLGARRQPVRGRAGPSAGDLYHRTPQQPGASCCTPRPGTSGSTRTVPTAATSSTCCCPGATTAGR